MPHKLPEHFFVSDSGDLFDTRLPNWSDKPLRARYAYAPRELATVQDVARALRHGAFTFPGAYELVFLASDGGSICFDCARENFHQIADSVFHDISDGWKVTALYHTGETDSAITCDHCNRDIQEESD